MYFFALLVLVTGLPLSVFLISVSQFILGLAWLLQRDYSVRIRSFLANRTALVISGVYAVHIAGLLYTSNTTSALNDLRIKLPLFVIPFIISTMPALPPARVKAVAALFTAAVFLGTLVSMAVLLGIIHHPVQDIRDISIFISHIRFSLLICLAVYFIAWRWYQERDRLRPFLKLLMAALICWFIVFLLILQSVTGIGILLITGMLVLSYFTFTQTRKAFKAALLALLILIPLLTYLSLKREVDRFYHVNTDYESNLETHTAQGNPYEHNTRIKHYENGYAIWVYICWPEMKSAWQKRSMLDFEEKDLKGQQLKYTLLRFLTSKGLRKDAEGVSQLSDKEIQAVEKGITNVSYQGIINFRGRIHMIIWEINNYLRGENPSGHSVTQRMEFWKAAFAIISRNPWLGVGTGDVRDAFRDEYSTAGSPLSQKWRLFSHNQYLTFTIAFGIAGLLYFLFSLVYPLRNRHRDFLYVIFWLILVISMVTEDTLETQAGVTFYAFFNSFLLFGRAQDSSRER